MASSIPDAAVERLTAEPLVAHLATSHDDRPHCAPVWFVYHDGAIEIATTGRKLRDIRENPRVSLSLQEAHDGDPVWGMTIRGTASVVEDQATDREILHRINDRYGADEDAWSENTAVRIDIGSLDHWDY